MHERAPLTVREEHDTDAPAPEAAPAAVRRRPVPMAGGGSLVVGAADDPAERDADRMADAALSLLRRSPTASALAATNTPTSRIRRSTGTAATTFAPAAVVGAEGGALDRATESRIRSAQGGGRPLAPDIQRSFGDAFGADLSGVRVHTDGRSAELNRSLSAEAFAIGSDVFLGGEAPRPGSAAGDRLLAHELAHVVQSGSAARRTVRRAYVKGSADEDAKLFKLTAPVDAALDGSAAAKAATFGITSTNMEHYLERHTFEYQRLNAKTVSPAAGMFPEGTTVGDVNAMLAEAIGKLPDGTAIGATPVSVSVTLANGLTVNLGALKGGKLAAFFPTAGAGYHLYSADELKAIRTAKKGGGTGGDHVTGQTHSDQLEAYFCYRDYRDLDVDEAPCVRGRIGDWSALAPLVDDNEDDMGLVVIRHGDAEVVIEDSLIATIVNVCVGAIPKLVDREHVVVSLVTTYGYVRMDPEGAHQLVLGDYIEPVRLPRAELIPALAGVGRAYLDFLQTCRAGADDFASTIELLSEQLDVADTALARWDGT